MPLDPIALKTLAIELSAALPPPAPAEPKERPVDLSERACVTRAIQRIADAYGWQCAITHFLETRGAEYMSDLSVLQLHDLLDRMKGYVDAAETGCSLADCLPAY